MAPPLLTADEVNDYIKDKIKQYSKGKQEDDVLWCVFVEDFEGWSESTFRLASASALRELRNTLKNRGVFIKSIAGYEVTKALVETLNSDDEPVRS